MPDGENRSKPRAPGVARRWRALRRALRDADRDYTRGPISQPIFLLAVPMVLESVLQSVFLLVDSFFIAQLGAEALAAVGLTAVVHSLVLTLAYGLGEATTALVARRIGEGDRRAAARAAVCALGLGCAAAGAIGAVGALLAGGVLAWMGGAPAVVEAGTAYAAITLGSSFTIYFVLIGNSVFRAAGDARTALVALWLANSLNVVLDPCLIFGLGPFPELGLVGAALASLVGWGATALFQAWVLVRGRRRVAIRGDSLRLEAPVLRKLVRIALPATANNLLGSASYLLLYRLVAVFGSAAVAAFTICSRLFLLAESPSWGLSHAAATLVGQNLGAGRADRAERSAWRVGLYTMLVQGAIGACYIAFAEPLVRLFSRDPQVIALGTDCLLWVSVGYALYAYSGVLGQAFSGAGDTVTPTVLNLGAMWLCQLPLAWLLALPLGFGPQGVFAALLVSESLLAAVTIAAFRRGRWKRRAV